MSDAYTLGGRRALAVWGTAVSVYFLAIFHRSSLGVAGLAAAERFHISASQLSTFTVLQLLVYAGMQIPVGVLLDRFGPQRLLISGAVFMTAAQLGFAYTGTYGGALVARVFVGMGDAMVFISVLRIIASWFPAFRSPLLTAFTAMLGQCGALVAAIPLSRALASYGWTATFVASASLGVLLGADHRAGGARRAAGRAAVPVAQGPPHGRARPAGWPGRTRAPGSGCGRTSPPSSPRT